MSEMFVKSEGYIEKASKLSEGEVEFVVSTGDLDAHGERMNVDGIDLKDFKKNPVVLWAHDGFDLPIANATKVWKEAGKLMARAKFFLDDDFAAKIYEYLVLGRLKAVSIGGMVQEWGSDGMTISKLLMKEFSVVSIPANPYALVTNKSLDPLTPTEMGELKSLANAYARKMLTKGDNEIFKNIETLETLVATLKEVAHSEPDVVEADENINRRVVLRTAQAVDKQVETVIRQIKLKGE